MNAREITYFFTVTLTLVFVASIDVCGILVMTGHGGAAATIIWAFFFYPPATLCAIAFLAMAIIVLMSTES